MHAGTLCAMVVYLLPWFQGVSLDLKKKLSICNPGAGLSFGCLQKKRKSTHVAKSGVYVCVCGGRE